MKTKYGNAKITNEGYYVITSGEYRKKLLHRLIFEDYHDCKLDSNDIIHHIDGDKTNNHPTNLICMSKKAHALLHHKDKIISEESKQKISMARNTSGYLNVYKEKCKKYKQGFRWKYQYYEDGKQKSIVSTDIKKLESKVKAHGLPWKKITESDKNAS
jgi:hypothetical protein